MLNRAAEFLRDDLAVDFGLLICSEERVPFYRKLGWRVVEGPLAFDQPGGKVTFSDITMVLPCRKKRWKKGRIDLCGFPW